MVKPRVIVALGATAAKALFGTDLPRHGAARARRDHPACRRGIRARCTRARCSGRRATCARRRERIRGRPQENRALDGEASVLIRMIPHGHRHRSALAHLRRVDPVLAAIIAARRAAAGSTRAARARTTMRWCARSSSSSCRARRRARSTAASASSIRGKRPRARAGARHERGGAARRGALAAEDRLPARPLGARRRPVAAARASGPRCRTTRSSSTWCR